MTDVTFDAHLIDRLRSAQHIVVLTGAGMSAESGIATFRQGPSALWTNVDPEEVATPKAFGRDPERVWRWHLERRDSMAAAQPNPGHIALAELEQHVPRLTLITQNVDGLHRRAGSHNVIELHGNLLQARCATEGTIYDTWPAPPPLPRCPECNALLRPNVVWFGERLDSALLEQAQAASFDCDMLIAIGTSGLVAPAATFPMNARAQRALLIEINPEKTPLSRHVRYGFRQPVGHVLPALVAAAWPPSARALAPLGSPATIKT